MLSSSRQGVLSWRFILILVAAKTNTFDIDLQFEVQPKHHTAFIRCLRQLSRQLKLPIEQASPEQFMPLPKGYQDRHQFIARYGLLDVFYFDFYSIALSKIHRGNEKDFVDVMQMQDDDMFIGGLTVAEYFALPDSEQARLWEEEHLEVEQELGYYEQ